VNKKEKSKIEVASSIMSVVEEENPSSCNTCVERKDF
jgi:hypothetical protein